MCYDCNDNIPKTGGPCHHGNACWSARAAEAAGKMWGEEGFWRMHEWLFSVKGMFPTSQILQDGIRSIGYDPTGFEEVMKSAEIDKLVRQDAAEAVSLGLHFTPMVFINGREIRGIHVNASELRRAIGQLSGANLPVLGFDADDPPNATAKMVEDWKQTKQTAVPPETRSYARGPADAKIDIVIFGDYELDRTKELLDRVRKAIDGRSDVRITFRNFVLNKQCNAPLAGKQIRTETTNGCAMAAAAEAAGMLGGADAFWKMTDWLLENSTSYSEDKLKHQAGQMGLDVAALLAMMKSQEVTAAIGEDHSAAQKLDIISGPVPAFIVNGRSVPRYQTSRENIVAAIIAEAGK
jgi:protein-disulfide isomerase